MKAIRQCVVAVMLLAGAMPGCGAEAGCCSVRRGYLWRAEAVAQSHADVDRAAGRRNVDRAEPVYGLSHDGDVRPRIGHADVSRSRLLCRRRRCGQFVGDVRQQVARASGARQGGQMDLAGLVRLGQGRRAGRGVRGAEIGAARRQDRHVPGCRDRQEVARLPRARPAAVRRQALSAVRRQRRILPEARRRRAGDAAGVCGLRRHRCAQAASASAHATLRTSRTGSPAIPRGRTARARD